MPTPLVPRPSRLSPDVLLAAALQVAPKLIQWLKEGGDERPPDVEEVAEDLQKVMRYSTLDGFDLAYRLKRDHMWECDEELVEILSGVSSAAYGTHQKALVEWLPSSGLDAPALESVVTHPAGRDGAGVVVSNYPDGTSTVYFEHLGHKRNMRGGECGTIGTVLPWEELQPFTPQS